jgi:hypothetical protein
MAIRPLNYARGMMSALPAISVGGAVLVERFSGLEIDYQFVLGRRLQGAVGD